MDNRKENTSHAYSIALILLIISNVCFYTADHIVIYIILTLFSVAIVAYKEMPYVITGKIERHFCIVWLLMIYGLFSFNGLLRLKAGTYNWDMMLYTCVQNCAMYYAIWKIMISSDWFRNLKRAIFISTIISLLVLALFEIRNLGINGLRIGDSLSGNVNVVAANFGILSIFIVYFCNKEKKALNWIVFGIVAAVMLLTGSKMTIIVLMIDLVYFILASTNKLKSILFVTLAGVGLLAVVFMIPYFYNVLGYRIVDMIYQLFGVGPGHYSNSTNVRKIMLIEGFKFFVNHPLWGGGEKYFASLTSTIYLYSHCNYTEVLCNFGMIGFSLYYFPLFLNAMLMYVNRKGKNELLILSSSLLTGRLLLDWMQVSYSVQCVEYLPIIFSFVYIKLLYRNQSCVETI